MLYVLTPAGHVLGEGVASWCMEGKGRGGNRDKKEGKRREGNRDKKEGKGRE